jgi:hypothetical protein
VHSVISLFSEFGYQVDCHQVDFRIFKVIGIYFVAQEANNYFNSSRGQLAKFLGISLLTFKNRASYIKDGRAATLQMLHYIYLLSTNIST